MREDDDGAVAMLFARSLDPADSALLDLGDGLDRTGAVGRVFDDTLQLVGTAELSITMPTQAGDRSSSIATSQSVPMMRNWIAKTRTREATQYSR